MSNTITFPDHDYLSDTITLTDASETGRSVGETLAVIEATKALRAQVEALQAKVTELEDERDDLVWVIRLEAGELSYYMGEDMTMYALRQYEIKSKYLPNLKIGA